MFRIALVEDDAQAAAAIAKHLQAFSAEGNEPCSLEHFDNGVVFLNDYHPVYELVLMDVEMPMMNGTDVARALREKDQSVTLVFITNMAQYAIHGYEVGALDYILKPVSYARFSALLKRVIRMRRENKDQEVTIRTPNGIRRVSEHAINYVHVEDHLLIYETDADAIESWSTLTQAEAELPAGHFFRIGKNCLINLRQITAVQGDEVWIGETSFTISRRKKKEFFSALNDYMGR